MMSPSHDSSEPLRKRARSDQSSEERKEARAHRNRIAAQNSRDRRKAHFSYLERRVNELEDENRQLRVSIGLLSQGHPAPTTLPVVSIPPKSPEDLARDRENAELKERIRTLERGWDAVVKALAAQGLPTGLGPAPAPPLSHPQPSPAIALPSPTPSHSSLDFDSDMSTSSTPVFVPTSSTSPSPSPRSIPIANSEEQSTKSTQQDSTRHLARVASTDSVALQRVVLSRPSSRPFPSLTPWQLGKLRLRQRRPQSTNRRWRSSSGRFSSRYLLARR
ncbi:hypothetical protein AGABI2DRAFT_196071 [Agaricus bisporus var. bisporus H97]|uniref:hypothetical protein n=1 Tax=Agaricus bisporus var. bisporus (strain H97 / ATCC MYA-4626 / FGSC 10389) TaxID=936046 RepID=UPI00029F538B|nr:hypothetical protein AGABI2DRAFT_196071 [Agaricus bisporus var. bisporus H97]EKV42054.1 hypothetical protein AGABI2DRAFT_196071 [Agaricus bisporus var. bisporus H97]